MIIRRAVVEQAGVLKSVKGFSLASFGLSGTVASVTFKVYGIVEDAVYTGGTTPSAGVKLNSTPDADRSQLRLWQSLNAGGDNYYYFNHAAVVTQGCVEWDVSFTLTNVDANDSFEFSLIAGNANTQEEPRDANNNDEWFNIKQAGAPDDAPQFAVLEVEVPAQTPNGVQTFKFAGFVDNVRLGGER